MKPCEFSGHVAGYTDVSGPEADELSVALGAVEVRVILIEKTCYTHDKGWHTGLVPWDYIEHYFDKDGLEVAMNGIRSWQPTGRTWHPDLLSRTMVVRRLVG